MQQSVFTVDHIDFSKTVFSKLISHLFSDKLSIGIANKQALLTHFGNATFDAMCNVIPFCAHSTATFGSPKRSRIFYSNIALPLCWHLPSHHIVTLSDDTPISLDAGTLQNVLDAQKDASSSPRPRKLCPNRIFLLQPKQIRDATGVSSQHQDQ